jgi:P27 family predicted phage terminase small subunit
VCSSDLGKAIFFRILEFLDRTKLEAIDSFELSVLAQNFDIFARASESVNIDGYSKPVGQNNYEQVTPHWTAMKDSANYIMKHADKFGLNPAARDKIKIFAKQEEKDPLADVYNIDIS